MDASLTSLINLKSSDVYCKHISCVIILLKKIFFFNYIVPSIATVTGVRLTIYPDCTRVRFLSQWLMVVKTSAPLSSPVCLPPTEPENGGYRCHPPGCHRLTHKTVIEYFCDEGYALKTVYKFLTCENGEWDRPMQISCRLTQGLSPKLAFF